MECGMVRLIPILVVLVTLSACETAKGAGRDIQKAGDAIEDTARQVQKKL